MAQRSPMSLSAASTGVLLVNLGSPSAPTSREIRRYLKEFLSDKRVLTMPALMRWLIVNLFILPFRPHTIRHKYRSIWSAAGFPLIVHGKKLEQALTSALGESYQVILAMRYGSPAIQHALERFRTSGIKKLLVLPLFPQYSSATSGSTIESVLESIKSWESFPELIVIPSFYTHAGFLNAWETLVRDYSNEKPDHTLFSFHGLPEKHILQADHSRQYCLKVEECCQTLSAKNQACYRAQCVYTAHQIAGRLGLNQSQFSISFQSRLGRAKWLEPYTGKHVADLAKKGIKRLLVVCPSFVADCLETTEEILVEVKQTFLDNGGESLLLVPSLNSHPAWIEALLSLIREKA